MTVSKMEKWAYSNPQLVSLIHWMYRIKALRYLRNRTFGISYAYQTVSPRAYGSCCFKGKSLSLICASLTWLREHKRKAFEEELEIDANGQQFVQGLRFEDQRLNKRRRG